MALGNKRSVMTLYSGGDDIHSHRVRLVLAEKGVVVDVLNVESGNMPEDLLDLNPYNTVPTLLDRDLVLYESRIIMEYLDERFPHPPLLPVYPVSRAKSRLMIYRIERDWYKMYNDIVSGTDQVSEKARTEMQSGLIALEPVFAEMPYFMSDEYSLVDCSIAPLLWRLSELGIDIPSKCNAIHNYMKRVFDRESFRASLSEDEQEMGIEDHA